MRLRSAISTSFLIVLFCGGSVSSVHALTNTPPLGAPNAVLASPGFGSITSAGDPRVIQLGIKFNF